MNPRSFLAGALLALVACGGADELGSYSLARSVEGAVRVEVVVPAKVDARRLERLAAAVERTGRFAVEFERAAVLDPRAARILFADAATPGIGAIAQRHGVVFEPGTGAVWFQGRRYHGPREGILLVVEDPRRALWPVCAYIASDAQVAAGLASELLPSWKPGFRTWRGGRIESEGLWSDHGGLLASSAGSALEELGTWPELVRAGPGCELVVHGAVDAGAEQRWVARLANVQRIAAAHFGEPGERVRVHLWPDGESFSAATGAKALSATCGSELDVHGIVAPEVLDDRGAGFARALALASLGEPREDWMADAVGAACAETWCGVVRLADWREHLRARGLAAGFEDALHAVDPLASPHLVLALRAALVAELLDMQRADLVRAMWTQGSGAVELPWAALRARWEANPLPRELVRERRARALAAGFSSGVHLTTPRDRDGRGLRTLSSRGAFAALDDLVGRGVDALALDPQVCARPRISWWPEGSRGAPFDSTVHDHELLVLARRARALGMRVMITPSLLDAPMSGLASASMTFGEAHWERFFEQLEALAIHYALLAELCDADLLCLGNGLGEATDSVRDDLAAGWNPPSYLLRNTARWRELIARVRRAWTGALTYAAWDLGEAQQLEFWDELDCVAVDLYRSLQVAADAADATPRPDDAACAERYGAFLRELRGFASTARKPWIVAEFGVPPTSLATRDPAAGLGSYDVGESARLARAFAAALASVRREPQPPAGVYVWCWTTDPEHGNGVDRSFTLQNRPAAEALAEMYGGG
ncbi:MAG: hypothetical protein FJ298_02315 [Planctomycetes bacterium]|nr:hypothetical protein [Planctomycetota bacterium]